MSEYTNVPWDLMERFLMGAFTGYGVPEADAKIVVDVLMEADRRGIESHGVNRFKPIYIDRMKAGIQNPVTHFEIVREGPTTAVIDGHDGMGQVIAYKAMNMAIEKAKKLGMGMVAVRNSTHFGIAGYYATMATKRGCVGWVGTNARPSIAPTHGVENMLGTNPITFGVPSDEPFDFLIDCASSITQRGKIEQYARLGEKTPEGMVINRKGEPLTDSEQILKDLVSGEAALAPLGGKNEALAGYKGYGFAVLIELLSSVLQAGSYMKLLNGIENGKKAPYHLGHFFVAIDVEAFNDLDAVRKQAGDILRELRASEKAPGHERIYTAGEKEYETWLQRKDTGVPVNTAVQQELIAVRDELKINIRFPFE